MKTLQVLFRSSRPARLGVVGGLAASIVWCAGACAPAADDGAPATSPAAAAKPNNYDQIGVIGDSLTKMNGNGPALITAQLVARGWQSQDVKVEGVYGMQISAFSGQPPSSSAQIIADWRAAGFDPRVWLIALGTNDNFASSPPWDSKRQAATRQVIDVITSGPAHDYKIYWVGLSFADGSGRNGEVPANNATLENFQATRSDFTACLYSDYLATKRSDPAWASWWRPTPTDLTHNTDLGYRQLRAPYYGDCVAPEAPTKPATTCAAMSAPAYQVVNPSSGASLVTISQSEASGAASKGYTENHGVPFDAAAAPATGLLPVYRLEKTSGSLLTIWEAEAASAVSKYGYTNRGVGFYATRSRVDACEVAVHRLLKGAQFRTAVAGGMDFTTWVGEGWQDQGVSFYAAPATNLVWHRRAPSGGLVVVGRSAMSIIFAPGCFSPPTHALVCVSVIVRAPRVLK